jgi:hypothetical protein
MSLLLMSLGGCVVVLVRFLWWLNREADIERAYREELERQRERVVAGLMGER